MAKSRSAYLHPQQRERIQQLSRSWLWRSELPTWLLIFAIYGGWFASLAWWRALGLFPATLLLVWFTAWYMSLQHELIHGHPTSRPWFNQLLGTLPLAVWYPYGLYRDSHLAHHNHHLLTQPVDDPESYYFTPQSWQHFALAAQSYSSAQYVYRQAAGSAAAGYCPDAQLRADGAASSAGEDASDVAGSRPAAGGAVGVDASP